MVAMPDKMLGERGLIAFGQSVAPDPALLDMSGGDGEDVAIPLPGGESHPGVRRIRRGMRAAIHPDGAVLFIGTDVLLDGDDMLGLRVFFVPDSQLERATIDVGSNVHLTLMLRHGQAR